MASITQLNDFGEKIGGARKDLWQQRGLLSDDLLEMNEREADKYVRKDNIWKKIDYQSMIDGGIPFDVAYYVKTVKDSLPASPQYLYTDKSPDSRLERQRQYIDTVREVQAVMETVRSKEDTLRVHGYLLDSGYLEQTGGIGSRYRATKKAYDNPAITNKLMNAMLVTSERAFERDITQKAIREQFGVPKEKKIPKGYEIRYNDGKNTWSKDNNWQPDTYYVTKGRSIVKTNLASREDALKWAQEAAGQQNSGKKQRYIPPQLEHIRRDGPDYRHDLDVAGQNYLDAFGFKGGEFGNWMNNTDRQASLNMGFDALKDLADALKISDRDISYQGDLSIAFGARGSGNAVAHYEPMRQVINLTKMRGAGSLAHEWWHGLDDYLGRKLGVKGYMSDNPHKHPLFGKLINTIKYKAESPEQAAARMEKSMAQYRKNAESWLPSAIGSSLQRAGDEKALATYEALKTAFLAGEAGIVEKLSALKKATVGRVIPKEMREKLEFFEGVLHREAQRSEPAIGKVSTDYYTDSKSFGKGYEKDGGYWDSNVELTARAFAAYVMDRQAGRSDYLTGHAECAIMTVEENGVSKVLRAYPVGQEREAINAVFDELVAELKLQKYLTHDDRVRPEPQLSPRPEPRPAPPPNFGESRDIQFEQLTFGEVFSQGAPTAVWTPPAYTSIELFSQRQDTGAEKLTLYEYGDRVELHRPDGIEKLLPEDGETAKDLFLTRMSDLMNDGYQIRVQSPIPNDPREIFAALEFIHGRSGNGEIEP